MECAPCSACGRSKAKFTYKALVCNSCTMAFRRIVKDSRNLVLCPKNGPCPPGCRCCRFQKCVAAGMTHGSSAEISRKLKASRLRDAVGTLRRMDSHREALLRNCYVVEDPSIGELVADEKCVEFRSRSHAANPCSVFDWAFHEQLTTIDFIRKFESARNLTSADLETFLKTSFFKMAIFVNAFRSYQNQRESMTFVDGSDVIPLTNTPFDSSVLVSNLRSRLVGKLIELRVSPDEFLLLLATFVCNPSLPNLSVEAQSVISSEQRRHSSDLLTLCQINWQQGAPGRFCELISLMQTIHENARDSTSFCLLFGMSREAPVDRKRIFEHTHF